MTHPSHPHQKLLVHCILSDVAMGCADRGRILDTDPDGSPCPTPHSLVDGDYLALKLQRPDAHRPVSVHLAQVTWVQGDRFGVELLIMDADERTHLDGFLAAHLPPEPEFQDIRSELTITVAE